MPTQDLFDGKPTRTDDAIYLLLRRRVGAAIHRQRLALDWSQTELAAALRCSQQQVARIEDQQNTTWNPRLTDLADIAMRLGLSVDDLLGDPMR